MCSWDHPPDLEIAPKGVFQLNFGSPLLAIMFFAVFTYGLWTLGRPVAFLYDGQKSGGKKYTFCHFIGNQ